MIVTSRRTWLRSVAALATLPALPSMPGLRSALDAYRLASAKLGAIEAAYARLAPEYDAHPSGSTGAAMLRRLESHLDAAMLARLDAERAVTSALDRAGLKGVADGPDLFAVADLEPEGTRRLIAIPVSGIGLAGR